MALLLRPDSYRADGPDGVHILTHRGMVRFDGPSLPMWIDRLAPYLDGRHTLSDITAGLPPDRREMVERILTALRDRDVVREIGEVREDGREQLSAAERTGYTPEISYLGYFRDQAASTFAHYRAHTALLVGAGPMLVALARAGLCSGLRVVRLVATGPDPTRLASLVDESRSWRRDPQQDVEWLLLGDPSAPDLAELVADVDLVVHSTTGEGPAEALDQCCARLGVPLAQVVVVTGEAWLVPVGHTGPAGGSFAAAWPRLRATGGPGPTAGPDPAVPEAALTAAASQLFHGVFRALTGRPEPDGRTVLTALRLDTLRSQLHSALPHPFSRQATAPSKAEFRARLAELERAERLTEEEFSQRAAAAVDPRTGVLALDDGDWAQLPVRVCRATVSDPVGLAGRASPPVTTIGVGFTYQQARCRAAMAGLVRYAVTMVDPRRLLDRGGRPVFDPAATGSTDLPAAVAALRSGTLAGAVRGYEVAGADRSRLVPVGTGFPALCAPQPLAGPAAGVAAGYAWLDAVLAGLLGQCRQLTLAELGRAAPTYRRVDLWRVPLDEPGARCRDILAALGELPEVREVTGSRGVPVLEIAHGDQAARHVAGMTVAAALGDGLLRVLLAVQARVNGDTGYPPPAATPALSPAEATAAEVAAVAAALRASGQTPVAVPLDHDPAVTGILPHLVNVVLCDD